jgi:putative metallohydrolase (TIGR04338 family)
MPRPTRSVLRTLADAFTGTLFPFTPAPHAAPPREKSVRGRPVRDSQRARLYDAERALRGGRRFVTVGECQAYVDDVLGSAWWQARFPRVREIRVTDGRGRRHAGAFVESRRIALPKWARNERVLLHEVAHHATPRDAAAHGPEYARIYVDLVHAFMGERAARRLLAAFEAHRVNVAEESPLALQRTMIFRESGSPPASSFAK